jgi:hypothetical protein
MMSKDAGFTKKGEKKAYIEFKREGNKSEYLYLISFSWIKQWVNFLRFSETFPPEKLDNNELYKKIEEQ